MINHGDRQATARATAAADPAANRDLEAPVKTHVAVDDLPLAITNPPRVDRGHIPLIQTTIGAEGAVVVVEVVQKVREAEVE